MNIAVLDFQKQSNERIKISKTIKLTSVMVLKNMDNDRKSLKLVKGIVIGWKIFETLFKIFFELFENLK